MNFSLKLVPILSLKPHEKIDPNRVERIKNQIQECGKVQTPLWVEKDHFIVLNGHHRLEALNQLGCHFAPCLILDYLSGLVDVDLCPGALVDSINKNAIIDRALHSQLYPPRSSYHTLKFNPPEYSVLLSHLLSGVVYE